MNKKKNYTCKICNTPWECYVFDEFSAPFSICMYCYMDIMNIINKYPMIQETCALCDNAKECAKVPLSNNTVNNKIFICRECYEKMKGLIQGKK